MSRRNRPVTKDMYWFAHGGSETLMNKNAVEEENESNSLDLIGHNQEKKMSSKDISLTDGSNSSGPSSLEDKLHPVDKRSAVEERRKLLLEAEQERNDAVMRKHMEREAALEARRNAQRSTIAFAFGSSVPRNVDALQSHQFTEPDCMSRSFTAGSSSSRVEDIMTKSMTAASISSAPRGRRKNDLMPTVPYERTAAPRVATSSSSRRRSVSMTRLDQLALPRKHYVEATTKANSTSSSLLKDGSSPNRPLSSASEHSGGRIISNVTRRVRSSPRKPRPVSIAGTMPDHQKLATPRLHEVKGSAIKKTPVRKTENEDMKKTTVAKSSTPKSAEKPKPSPRPAKTPKPTPPPKTTSAKPKTPLQKEKFNSSASSAKPQTSKAPLVNKKKNDVQVSSSPKSEDNKVDRSEKSGSPLPDSDSGVESDKNNKRIISEEEAKAALAEKRRLAREQAEREAELERQRQEELRRQEEDRLLKEEEEQRKMEEESLRLLEEHRRQEEEKLRKAIEDQEQKKEEERARQEEELRLKAEQDRKAKEESEKIRIEMEEKLRREEEERAERKKRLEKIMSRTRGKSSATSPSGSVSGSDQMDSSDNQQEGFSSGANSLESNEGANSPSEPVSSDDPIAKMEVSSSGANSLEANLTYEFSSNDVSLNSNDLMLPASELASQESSLVVSVAEAARHASNEDSSHVVTPVNADEEVVSGSDQFNSETEVFPPTVEEGTIMPQNIGESEIPAVNSESSADQDAPVASDLETQSHFEMIEEGNTEQLFDKTSELDTKVFEQKEEINQLMQSSEDGFERNEPNGFEHGNLDGFEPNYDNFEGNVKSSDSQEISSVDEGFVQHAATETSFVRDQLFEKNQDLFSDSLVEGQKLVSDGEPQDQNNTEEPLETAENRISGQTDVFTGDKDTPKQRDEGAGVEKVQFVESSASNFDADHLHSTLSSNFDGVEAFKSAAEVNVDNPFYSNFGGAGDANEAFNSEKTATGVNQFVDNPFVSNSDGAGDGDIAFNSEKTAADVIVSADNLFVNNPYETEQNLFSSRFGVDDSKVSAEVDSSNVTLIKQDGGDKYVGIISSLDNDHFSNNFPKLNERLANNLESEDSEDSSLDSNLSQVIAPESDTNNHQSSNNTDNPFMNHFNQSSIPHSEFEVYSNGHSTLESSKMVTDYGNGILNVDNNIFESVGAIDKISSDPFLAKGSSNQMSGNPFLMQEEQNPKVLMTSDFLN